MGRALNHRAFVGPTTHFDAIGELQFRYLTRRGLQPNNVLLDVGCGCLRAGRLFVGYLDSGNYLGFDHLQWVVDAGIREELEAGVMEDKRPQFVVNDDFDFAGFDRSPNVVLAQSLFTHLNRRDSIRCMAGVRKIVEAGSLFHATHFRFRADALPDSVPSFDAAVFAYPVSRFGVMASKAGWELIEEVPESEWRHPFGQRMLVLKAA